MAPPGARHRTRRGSPRERQAHPGGAVRAPGGVDSAGIWTELARVRIADMVTAKTPILERAARNIISMPRSIRIEINLNGFEISIRSIMQSAVTLSKSILSIIHTLNYPQNNFRPTTAGILLHEIYVVYKDTEKLHYVFTRNIIIKNWKDLNFILIERDIDNYYWNNFICIWKKHERKLYIALSLKFYLILFIINV